MVAAITPEALPSYGEVFTRRWVVEAMLDLAGYVDTADLASKRAVEPSVGSGAFWLPMLERLLASAARNDVPFKNLGDTLRGFDLQPEHVATCRALSVERLLNSGCEPEVARKLAGTWLQTADFLLDEEPLSADFVIANPPYIRWDDLSPALATSYRRRWGTMRGRVDIYVGFFERALSILRPGGRLTFICADRWMRNAYGADLRRFVTSRFAVEYVWQMHDVDAFEAEVSAYPAIVQIANAPQGDVIMAECLADFDANDAAELVRFGNAEVIHELSFSAHRVSGWFDGGDLWPAGSPDRIALIEHLNETFPSIEETGVKIGIGIATGADKAYIAPGTVDIEPDRKLPIVVTNDIRGGRLDWSGKVLLNPWHPDGGLIDLADYPKLAAHYRAHPALLERFVARKNPRAWFRTIDKITPGLLERPKLLLQDMKAQITPVFDPGGHYPSHNLYYMVSDAWDLEVLGGLLLSRIAQAFIEAYGVRMRGGTLRFQSQYLRKIHVPAPDTLSAELSERLRAAFRTGDRDAATGAAEEAYALSVGEL